MTELAITPTAVAKDSSLHLLLAGLMLGVAADLLLWDTDLLGPGFSLWVMLLGLCALGLNRQAGGQWRLKLALWSSIAVVATLILVFRAAVVLLPLTAIVLILCAVAISMQAAGVRLGTASVIDLLTALLRLPLRVVSGAWPLLQRIDLKGSRFSPRMQGIVRGVLMAVPLLWLFVALFSSADARFERHVSWFGDLLSQELLRHTLFVAVFGWFSMGLLRCTKPLDEARPGPGRPPQRRLGSEETAIIMGTLVTLFGIFVLLQLGYLFAGREVIEQTSGLTLAQYARRGFFELLVASALAMGLLHWLSSQLPNRRLFVPLALALVALVMCILVSAAQRLGLYMSEFGLTLARLMAVACMGWIVCNLLLFAVLLLHERTVGLVAGYLMSGIVIVLAVGIANPVAIVASVNVQHSISARQPLDLGYLMGLGADVVPPLLARLPDMPVATQRAVVAELQARYGDQSARDADWRDWNASRASAQRLVQTHTVF